MRLTRGYSAASAKAIAASGAGGGEGEQEVETLWPGDIHEPSMVTIHLYQ
jgi:hypothetical protein